MPATGICDLPVVSSNGQWVAFISTATALTPSTPPGGFHAYLHNMQTGLTQLLDADTNGVGAGVNPTTVPALSADGSIAALESANVLNDNRRLTYDVFACNTASNNAVLISAHHPLLASQMPDGISGFTSSSVSSNGQFVAFYSDADDLAPNDTNATRDVFVRDLVLGTNILVSVNTNGVAGDFLSTDPAINGSGRYVAFTSSADDLASGDANNAQDVFVRDLQSGTTALVSISTDGVHSGNRDSFSPIISSDGRYVLFHSKASNLAAGSFGTGIENLFFRDLQTATTYALTSGAGVNSASMTPDGHWVVFYGTSAATSTTALYVWNSQSAALTYTNSATTSPVVSLSPDGQKLAFLTSLPNNLFVVDLVSNTVTMINSPGTFQAYAGIQLSSDGRFVTYAAATIPASQNVYLYDLQAGTNLLISQNFGATGAGNGNSDSPAISSDGRWVVFRSFATNIVPDDSNNVPDLFIYDVSNNATILASVNASGSSVADDRSLKPVFSADGRILCFQSWASDVASNDFNNGSDVYALDLTALPVTSSGGGGSTNPASIFYAQLLPAGSFMPNPTVSWQLASGKTYQVQYKNNLGDLLWQNLPGNLTFIGDTGYVIDASPPPDNRFYRIVLRP
jgi:Tol biopolymer transport system component